MSFWQKFALYAGLPEMRLFWIFLPFLVVFLAINFYYLPFLWFLFSLAIFLILTAVIFWNNLRLARSNLQIKVERTELQSIISNLEDGVIAYDPDFKILIFNQAAERIFALRKEEVLGKTFTPNSAGEKRLALLTMVVFPSLAPVVVQRREPGTFPQLTDLSFEELLVELRMATDRILDSSGRLLGFVKLIHDRTREVSLARSKNEFISVAAHQLRTPLSAVNWAFETLSRETLSDEEKQIVKGGLESGVKLLKTVNDLLDVSKIEEGRFGYKFENVNILDFIKGVIGEAQNLYPKSTVKIYFKKPAESSIAATIDPDRLKIALLNILDNAVNYNVENGQVVVGVERLKNSPYIEVSVKDTGIGIPPSEMNKLFTRFFRAENVQKLVPDGTGLGLYIVKNIVKSHGGDIRAESELNRGSVFYFTLPTDPGLIPPKEVSYGEE